MHEKIAVVSWNTEKQWHSAGALRLDSLLPGKLALVEHGKKNIEAYIEDVWRRQSMWLDTLSFPSYCLPDGTMAERKFELRFISLAKDNHEEKKLDIALLCMLVHHEPEVTTRALLCQMDDMYETLQSIQPESHWSMIDSKDELEHLLHPFTICYGAEICRRRGQIEVAGNTPLDPENSRFRLFRIGFNDTETPDAPEDNTVCNPVERLFTVFSFNHCMQGWDALCDRMLQHDETVMVRFSLQPTTLTTSEQDSFEALIGRMYALEGGYGDRDGWRIPFTTQLRALIGHLSRQLISFRNCVFEVHIEILGNTPLQQGLLEYLGSTITRPVGYPRISGDHGEIVSGGFDWGFLPGGDELDASVRRMYSIAVLADAAPEKLRRWVYLMDPLNALAAFHPPFVTDDRFSGVRMLPVRTVADSAFSGEGTVIGINTHLGSEREVTIAIDDRRRHMYLVGQTGTGKTTMLEKMFVEDVNNGNGVCLLDPHGDLVENVLRKIPRVRHKDLIYINPEDDARPVGINMLEHEGDREKQFVVQEMISIMERLFDDKYKGNTVTGPIFYHYFRMALLYIMADDEHPPTILDLYRFFNIENYHLAFDRYVRELHDPMLDAFIQGETFNFRRGQESTFASYITSKLDNFLVDHMLRNIICQERSTIDFDEIVNGRKILLVNLAKGAMGEINSRFFGMLMISKLQMAAMRRVKQRPAERVDFYVYVDEFQNIATSNFAVLLAEARKYRMNMVLANQFVNQLRPDIVDALQGNVGSTVIFRCGVEDAEFFSRLTEPTFSKNDLMLLPNRHAVALLLKNGQITPPFTIGTLLAQELDGNTDVSQLIEESLSVYGLDRETVEKEMKSSFQKRLITINEEKKRIADMAPPSKKEFH